MCITPCYSTLIIFPTPTSSFSGGSPFGLEDRTRPSPGSKWWGARFLTGTLDSGCRLQPQMATHPRTSLRHCRGDGESLRSQGCTCSRHKCSKAGEKDSQMLLGCIQVSHFLFLIFKPVCEHWTRGEATSTNRTERQCWIFIHSSNIWWSYSPAL